MRRFTRTASRAAWLLGGAAVVSLIGYLALGWVELLVAGGFLATLLAVSTLFLLGDRTLTATVDLGSRRAVVGERAHGRIKVRNTGPRRVLPSRVELAVGEEQAAFAVPSLRAEREHEDRFVLPTERRGVITVGPVAVLRTDPLALLRHERTLVLEQTLYVHPATVRVDGLTAGSIRDLEGRAVRELTDSDVAFHALRDYETGDDRRFIHWKSTARTGTLMVRQFEQTQRSHLLIVVSTRAADYTTDIDFETAVSVTGSFGVQALTDGQTLTVATSSDTVATSSGRRLLDGLSGIDPAADAPSLADLAPRLTGEVSRASIVLFVCGSAVDAEEIRRARHHLPVDMRTVVVQCGGGGRVKPQRVGDVDLVSIRRLEQLPGVRRSLR